MVVLLDGAMLECGVELGDVMAERVENLESLESSERCKLAFHSNLCIIVGKEFLDMFVASKSLSLCKRGIVL
jgi:hypothetical protein